MLQYAQTDKNIDYMQGCNLKFLYDLNLVITLKLVS